MGHTFPMYGDTDYCRTTTDLPPFLTSVDIIEALTGLDSLSAAGLAEEVEEELERVVHSKLWN